MFPPKISVVTSSFNQGRFIGRTIESVLAQNYENLEHIVVDGMSKDDTPKILSRYPHLRVIREPDSGQAEAINKGFRHATGEIFCFLNSDDTLEPGALHRVAHEIDRAAARHVVMGRCRFVDEEDRFIGVEHPSTFESHRRVLEIWKGHAIPQPAVFWTREVWERCGPLDEREHLVLDYDLFCRFSREYVFHPFDQVVANYRLHAQSKTEGVDDAQRMRESIEVSRRYWGPPWSPRGAAIRLSYARYQFDRRGRAYRALVRGRSALREGRRLDASWRIVAGTVLGPEVALAGAAAPLARRLARPARGLAVALRRLRRGTTVHPQTAAWRGFTALHPDGWAGPHVVLEFERPTGQKPRLFLQGDVPYPPSSPLALTLSVPGTTPVRLEVGREQWFSTTVPITHLAPGRYSLAVDASAYIVPHDLWGNGDFRPLAYRLRKFEVREESSTT